MKMNNMFKKMNEEELSSLKFNFKKFSNIDDFVKV